MPSGRASARAIRRPAGAGRRLARAARRAAIISLLLAAAAGVAGAGPLPYAPALARCYQAILDARFDEAEAEIAKACGPAPPETCALMRVNAIWWQIQLNPNDRSKDRPFQSQLDAALDRIQAWTARDPKRADGWFFLGAAYGLRVQFHALRGERLAAARDGKRIKEALEKSLALDPTLQDAYFGIGLYHYYAGIAPAILKVLAWLLALPGGDRAEGLQEMWRARNRGELLRGEADYQFALVDLWYERKPEEALTLLEGLRNAYPHNPLFLASIADVQDVYRHDYPASLDAWRALGALARDARVAFPAMSEVRAHLGAAVELDALSETDASVDELQAALAAKPPAPYGAVALASLRLGAACDRLGLRDRATDAYQAAIAAAPSDDPDNVRPQAREAMRRRQDPRTANAYRLSLEGLRALERRALPQAQQSLDRSLALSPNDPVTVYRHGLLLVALHRETDALADFERALASHPAPPPFALAAASLEAARLLEAAGARDRAVGLYQRAARTRGAAAETRQSAEKALDRLRAPR